MWDERATRSAVNKILVEIKTNIDRRRDANGKPYPSGYDLRETGRLQSSFRVRVGGQSGSVINDTSYAGIVNSRVEYMGLPEDNLKNVDRTIEIELSRIEKDLP